MKSRNQGNIAIRISIMFGSIILILVATFAYYMFIKPQELVINEIEYTNINKSDYNVNEDELNSGLFLTNNFDVDNTNVQMHKDLKDLYSGRNNPFQEFSDNREDIDTINELNQEIENKNKQQSNHSSSNNQDEEIIY